MFCGLQVDDGHLASLALGDERQVAAGLDLQGGAERQRQVCSPERRRKASQIMSWSYFFFYCPLYCHFIVAAARWCGQN